MHLLYVLGVLVLEASGYGLLQLPPPGEHRLLLAALLARYDLPLEEQQRWRVSGD